MSPITPELYDEKSYYQLIVSKYEKLAKKDVFKIPKVSQSVFNIKK